MPHDTVLKRHRDNWSQYMFQHYSTLHCNFILIGTHYIVDCPCPPPPPSQPHLHMWNSCIVFSFSFQWYAWIFPTMHSYRDVEVKRKPHSLLARPLTGGLESVTHFRLTGLTEYCKISAWGLHLKKLGNKCSGEKGNWFWAQLKICQNIFLPSSLQYCQY